MKYLIIAITTLMLITTSYVFLKAEDSLMNEEKVLINKNKTIFHVPLYELFYNEDNFAKAIKISEEIRKEKNISAVIVPHHLVGSDIISGILKRASGKKYNNIVIIGANHFRSEIDNIQTTTGIWETHLGEVKVNNYLAEKLINDFGIVSKNEMFLEEHSIGSVLPFVDYYFDNFELLPIAVSTYAGEKEARKLSAWLAENFDENDLIIYSIDFSHYLTFEQAKEMDYITRDLIESRDVGSVLSLNDDNVDSPVSLAVSLLNSEKLNLETKIVYNKNSFEYMSEKPIETTSYFGIIFTK